MRHAICYVSNKDKNLDHQQVKELLDFCHLQNERLGIKGVFLYSEGNFFQILEGEKDVVLKIFEKIKKDSRHYGIIQIIGRDITQGSCDGYKVDILNNNVKNGYRIPDAYVEALQGLPQSVKQPMERMLENFIATR